jgi:hypothetical protein
VGRGDPIISRKQHDAVYHEMTFLGRTRWLDPLAGSPTVPENPPPAHTFNGPNCLNSLAGGIRACVESSEGRREWGVYLTKTIKTSFESLIADIRNKWHLVISSDNFASTGPD